LEADFLLEDTSQWTTLLKQAPDLILQKSKERLASFVNPISMV
jgi:hypothetical protein